MFDEKKCCWIKIYKAIIITLFFCAIIFGIVAGIGDASSKYLDIGIGGDDDGFLDFIVWVIASGFIGFIQLTANMLVLQLLNNIQIIRERLEK